MFGNILKMLFSTTTHTKSTTTQQENHQNPTTHATTTTTKIWDQRKKLKNQNHKQILLQKFQTRSVTGSQVRGFAVWLTSAIGAMWLTVRGFAVWRSRVRGFAVRLTGGAAILGFLGSRSLSLSVCACESFLSLFLSLCVSRNDLKVKFWLKIFFGSKALILRLTEILFRKIHFPYATKHPHLRNSISRSDLKSKQTQPLLKLKIFY